MCPRNHIQQLFVTKNKKKKKKIIRKNVLLILFLDNTDGIWRLGEKKNYIQKIVLKIKKKGHTHTHNCLTECMKKMNRKRWIYTHKQTSNCFLCVCVSVEMIKCSVRRSRLMFKDCAVQPKRQMTENANCCGCCCCSFYYTSMTMVLINIQESTITTSLCLAVDRLYLQN